MLITVAICTLNRASSLRRTLESLAAMRQPERIDWELVVVNNGCTDDTDLVIQSFANRLPLRREFEAQRGHSRALNHAVDVSNGEYIVWTDDDVVVDQDWLVAYTEAFRRWPQASVFGGPIVPRYHSPVPPWLVDNEAVIGGVFAYCDYGNSARPLSDAEGLLLPYGPNFAVRTEVQKKFPYNVALGLGPNQRRRGEEIDVIERMIRSGGTGYWVPKARVQHCVRPEMQTIYYVSQYFMSVGEARAVVQGKDRTSVLWFGVPRWLWRELIEEWTRFQICRLISPARVWLMHLRDYSTAWGSIRYWRSQQSTRLLAEDAA
jgi:glycosyltransferase involved in cell wall biosynthesis